MIDVVTFDAADTLISHEWDGGGLLLESANECGVGPTDIELARAAYQQIIVATRTEHEAIELRGERSEVRAYWQRVTAGWLDAVGADSAAATEVHQVAEQKLFSQHALIWNLYDDVLPTIVLLKEMDIRIGVLSNWDSSLHRILEMLGVLGQFDFVIASLEHGIEKPDPGIFRIAERIGGFEANRALHVGDSLEDDVCGARAAGWSALLLDRAVSCDLSIGRIQSLEQVLEAAKQCA